MNSHQIRRDIDFQYDRDLACLLATIISKEHEIEKFRCLLCENDKFDVQEAFRSLDSHGHGYLTSNDLKIFLSFLKIVLPKQEDDLKEQCLARRKFRPFNQKPQLPFYLEEQLSKIFELEIQYIRETEAQKMDIMNNNGWNYRESFKRIARPGQYHIDKQAQFQEYDNDIITMDEFCNAIFPSDFLSDNRDQNEKIQNPYFRYVKGDESELIEYIKGTNRAYDDQDKFNQEDYVFHNDVDNYYEQKKRQGYSQPRKFLKTSMQYENSLNFKPMIGVENLQAKDNYPTLNKYLMKAENLKMPQNYRFNGSLAPKHQLANPRSQSANHFYNENISNTNIQSQKDLQQSIRSPINQISSQKKLYLDYENFNKQNKGNMNDYLDSQLQNQQLQFPKSHLKSQEQLAKENQIQSQANTSNHIIKSMPPVSKPIGINASTAKFEKPNYRSQYNGQRIQPFRPQDFTKSRFEY